ncbi:WYL domain-containing protein [Flavobacterium sp. CBA20B-1]|uniref:helix-turn-helix transcriptional regulator n=1 Tax=unclassified Flavobacterium TaxID=196869 RepID=UPI002225B3EF|nr:MULTISPECIES: WYL domain-containing protein [unclassified Flavobacterium]WCM41607.1 WYL domain-containing protein [Flavobacterium sp. CBA20B-1]
MASKHNLISRLTRIVELFQLHGSSGLSFDELNNKLKNAFVDEDHSVSLRTFQRDLKDIESSLKIKIIFDKVKKKYLLVQDELQNTSKNTQLFTLESLKMLHIAQDVSVNNFILIDERKATGLENYNCIKDAICSKKHLEFNYQKFDQYKSDRRKLMPLALKESKKRWYVVGFEIKNGSKIPALKTFALDRMYDCEATTEFILKDTIDVHKHFARFMGVTTKPLEGFSEKVTVILETSIEYGKYFSTLPIHPSQKTEIENGKTIITLQLIPTMELVSEILSHNHQIKVVQPKELIHIIKKTLSQNLKQYN